MSGRYRLAFQNGSALVLDAVPALQLRPTPEGPQVSARLPLEDYVARVVDREGQARETQAAPGGERSRRNQRSGAGPARKRAGADDPAEAATGAVRPGLDSAGRATLNGRAERRQR